MKYWMVSYALLLLFSCGGGEQKEKCKYGAPVPIFSEGIKRVLSHDFQRNGQKAVESLSFADSTSLEIFQSGCNEIRQEFRFSLKMINTLLPDSLWFDKATERMLFLGALDQRYMSLGMTGELIRQEKAQMQLGQFQQVDFDTYLMVDRIVEPNNTLLIIVMEKRS